MKLDAATKHQLFREVREAIEKASRIMIVTHQRPDGDALGSALAFSQYLDHLQKVHDVYCAHDAPSNYAFLPNSSRIITDPNLIISGDHDLIVCLDSGDLRYAGVDAHVAKKTGDYTLVNIDHHATNERYGNINLVDPSASSTSELIYHYFDHHGHPISTDVATCILTGIITDTGGFSNLATTSVSMDVASKLLTAGARIWDIQTNTAKNKPINALKLWGVALSRLQLHAASGIVTTILTKQDVVDAQATPENVEGIANFLNTVEGARAIFVLREEDDGKIKVSMRTTTPGVDVSKLARHFGGGGHKKAAGFTVMGSLKKTSAGWMIR